MNITFAPRDILQIDDARIIFRNFSGAASKYNRAGDRNFAVIIPNDKQVNDLEERGWNVKVKPPREDGEEPFRYLPVKVKFNDRGPAVYLQSGSRRRRLDEEDVGIIDNIDIESVDLDIRPYNWTVDGESGRSAYLSAICVIQRTDRFYSDEMDSDEAPF